MNFRKFTAVCCVAALITGALPFSGIASAESEASVEAQSSSNEINFTAVGQYTKINITNSAEAPTWYSDNTNVAEVDSTGKVTAVGVGTANVYAVFSDQILQFPITVTVEEAPEVTDIEVGTITLTNDAPGADISLEGIDLTGAVWTSSDTSVAVVNSDGVISAVGKGNCTVTASLNNKNYIISVVSEYEPVELPEEVVVGSFELTSENPSIIISFESVPEGTAIQWSSTDESVATVDDNGVVTAVGEGKCQIIALIDGVKHITDITSTYQAPTMPEEVMLQSVTLTNDEPSVLIMLTGLPEGTVVEWSSSDTAVAVVDSTGIITATGGGSCRIIALIDGIKYITEVTSTYTPAPKAEITASSTTIGGIGSTLQLGLANTDETAQWLSSDVNVATVDENGLVTAVGVGEVVIFAKLSGQVCSINLTVTAETVTYGDADCNGTVDVNDAVLVMSYLANKEKYSLAEDGLNNCDVYQRGDGLSIGDANSIQKFLAKKINTLPEA